MLFELHIVLTFRTRVRPCGFWVNGLAIFGADVMHSLVCVYNKYVMGGMNFNNGYGHHPLLKFIPLCLYFWIPQHVF